MIETLTSSGALWELHAWKDEFAIAARFKALRLKQLRRAIRRQKFAILRLKLRCLRDLCVSRFSPNSSHVTRHTSLSQ
jgi:hypothetical protein